MTAEDRKKWLSSLTKGDTVIREGGDLSVADRLYGATWKISRFSQEDAARNPPNGVIYPIDDIEASRKVGISSVRRALGAAGIGLSDLAVVEIKRIVDADQEGTLSDAESYRKERDANKELVDRVAAENAQLRKKIAELSK